jgi:hypothetical protein
VLPATTIEGFEEAEDSSSGLLTCFEHDIVVIQFVLHTAEDAFHWPVVPAIAFPVHGAAHAVFLQQAAVGMRGILAAAVRMMQQAWARAALGIAISSAPIVNAGSMVSLIVQPMVLRTNMSSATAK